MNYGQRLKLQEYDDLWSEYCGFLDLSIEEYMSIQNRLMSEQLCLWEKSGIGQKILKGKHPRTLEEYFNMVPLTTYCDYAEVLLNKREDMLPADANLWLRTTWEGGKHPIKLAPYTKGMLDVFRNNLLSIASLSACTPNKKIKLRDGDTVLFGLAPLPYVSGLFPYAFEGELDLKFMPPAREAANMSFSERNKKGFTMGMQRDINGFFGLGSVMNYVTANFATMLAKSSSGGSKLKKILNMSPSMAIKYAIATYRCKHENRDILPRDLFNLKSLCIAGTDSTSYKRSLEKAWGVMPLEIFAGTEVSIAATETWSRTGMVFFPDACFYEFIPEEEFQKNLENPSYEPRTVFMDKVIPHTNYELVISVLKGGVFARYRIGDMFRCLGIGDELSTSLPRFAYVDRVSTVIDIAGFTRITENSINEVISLSGLAIKDWAAKKEYDSKKRPYMHLYVEMDPASLHTSAISKKLLNEHLCVYFSYFDSDYMDLRKMLGIEPLKITILKCGAFERFEGKTGKKIRKVNPSALELDILVALASKDLTVKGGSIGDS